MSVFVVVCLCFYNFVRDIRVWGIKLEGKELLFLIKIFSRFGNGRINLDIGLAGGDYVFDVVNILLDFDFFDDF